MRWTLDRSPTQVSEYNNVCAKDGCTRQVTSGHVFRRPGTTRLYCSQEHCDQGELEHLNRALGALRGGNQ